MSIAYNMLRPEPFYRRDAFDAGLAKCGYLISHDRPIVAKRDDVLLTWNRYGDGHALARMFEGEGAKVLVAENGYIGRGGESPHSMQNREPYAIARSFHNDSDVILEEGPERWAALGIELKPWRPYTREGHILICPNRPFGIPTRAMPGDWAADLAYKLRPMTHRTVRVRPHPGNNAPAKPLAEDLEGAHVCIIWTSSSGVHALAAGVPVICAAPHWICRPAALTDLSAAAMLSKAVDDLPIDVDDRRSKALNRLAGAQWFLSEIEQGRPFRALLGLA